LNNGTGPRNGDRLIAPVRAAGDIRPGNIRRGATAGLPSGLGGIPTRSFSNIQDDFCRRASICPSARLPPLSAADIALAADARHSIRRDSEYGG